MINIGAEVDLYYYAEANGVRSVSGRIDDANGQYVILIDTSGVVHAYPLTSIQRMILRETR